MSTNELLRNVENLIAAEALLEELKAEAEEIRNAIKAEMDSREVEELEIGGHVVRNTSVLTQRFDSKALKEKMGVDFYKMFTKQVASRRFSVC